jgi:hypothetical protein
VDFEEPWQRWVRLSVGSPARLLSLAETAATMETVGAA